MIPCNYVSSTCVYQPHGVPTNRTAPYLANLVLRLVVRWTRGPSQEEKEFAGHITDLIYIFFYVYVIIDNSVVSVPALGQ
jgi:hypothetical protein